MLPLSYTASLELLEHIKIIDILRTRILTKPLSPEIERVLRFEALLFRIQGSLALANLKIGRKDIERSLFHPLKNSSAVECGYKQALDQISDHWAGATDSLKPKDLEAFIEVSYVGVFTPFKRTLSPLQPAVRQLFSYLENQSERPIIQSGIALGILSGFIFPPEDPGLASRLVAGAFLSKHGYDVRGLTTIEHQWASDMSSYKLALQSIRAEGNLNHWLLYFVQSIEADFTRRLDTISSSNSWKKIPISQRLNDRQRTILHLLENPELQITNKMVQKRFKISQITASRDLARLSSLTLIAPHGKGRSVSYSGM